MMERHELSPEMITRRDAAMDVKRRADAAAAARKNHSQAVAAARPVGTVSTTNTMAVLALVFAFVFAPLGIVFGVIGRRQVNETGQEGHGLATAGLILGALFTGIFVLFLLALVVLGAAVSA